MEAPHEPISGKCPHCNFYFIDEPVGVCYLCIASGAPFRLRIDFSGHSWLACQLLEADVHFEVIDNAAVSLSDIRKEQKLGDGIDAHSLRKYLDWRAQRFFPLLQHFRCRDHRRFIQVESALISMTFGPESYLSDKKLTTATASRFWLQLGTRGIPDL